MGFLLSIVLIWWLISVLNKGSSSQKERRRIAQWLREQSQNPNLENEKKTYLAIANSIEYDVDLEPQYGGGKSKRKSADTEDGSISDAGDQKSVQPAYSSAAAPENNVVGAVKPQQRQNPFELLENINVLLFSGALLVIVSAAILVNASFDDLSGGMKMFLVALAAGAFYGTGLYLYKNYPKLKPAGVAFTSIGMILITLFGVAYRNFVDEEVSTEAIWFVVSVISLGAYILTARIIRHELVQYAVVLAALSSIESGLVNLGGSVHILAWAGIVLALIMIQYQVRGKPDEISVGPLRNTALLVAPISIGGSILSLLEQQVDYWQAAVTMALAAVFYIQLAWMEKNRQTAETYFWLSLALSTAAVPMLVYEFGGSMAVMAYSVSVASYFWMLGWNMARSEGLWISQFSTALKSAHYLSLGAALLIGIADSFEIFLTLTSIMIVIHGANFALFKNASSLMATAIGALAWPVTLITVMDRPPDDERLIAAGLYLLVFVVYFTLRSTVASGEREKNRLDAGSADAAFIAYFLSIFGFWASLATQGDASVPISAAIAAGLFVLTAWREANSYFLFLAAFAVYVTAAGWLDHANADDSAIALGISLTGLLMYGAGYLLSAQSNMKTAGDVLKISAAGGLAVGIFNEETGYGILSLATLSGLGLYEAWERRKTDLLYASGAGIVVSVHWWLVAIAEIDDAAILGHVWGVFFAILAWHQHRRNSQDNKDLLTAAALAVSTMPMVFLALDTGEGLRILLLFGESILLIMAGIAMNYRLVLMWGAALLVGEVFYQIRDVIFGLPKQLISFFVGIGLLGVAVYYLNQRTDEK